MTITGYNPGPGGILWSSGGWGNGWAGTPGGVGLQLGLKGRALGEFARWVNMQTRYQAQKDSGYDYGYNPEWSFDKMPSWIKQLYATQGASGASQATGKSGAGQYVNQAAYGGMGTGSGFSGGGMSSMAQAKAQGLTGRAAATYARNLNMEKRRTAERETGYDYGGGTINGSMRIRGAR